MKNTDYLKFYNGCLKDKCTVEKYKPERERIKKLVVYAESIDGFVVRGWRDKYTEGQIKYIKDIFKLFTRIMKDKNADKFDEYASLFMTRGQKPELLMKNLFICMYKDDLFTESFYYLRAFQNLVEEFKYNVPTKLAYDDGRIFDLIRVHNSFAPDSYQLFFESAAQNMIADFYKTDLDPSYLKKIYEKAILNGYKNVFEKYKINNVWYERYPSDVFINMIIKDTETHLSIH